VSVPDRTPEEPRSAEPRVRPRVSILVPMLNEAENVPFFVEHYQELTRRHPDHDFELVVVDDGSTDGTAELVRTALSHAGDDVDAAIVSLSRNFGSHYAISAALEVATGEAAIVLGADLQEPPELVADMLARWHEGAEVVWGVRRTRAEMRGLGPALSRAFSALLHRYSDLTTYPAEGPSGVLCDRIVIDQVVRLQERNRNVLGLIAWVGFRQETVAYDQVDRRAGTTKWTRRKLFHLALDSFVQFSSAPIKLATMAGTAIALLGFAYALFLVGWAAVGDGGPEGWTTVVVAVLIVGGLQLIMLGVFGEYLWRTTDESRHRPVFVLRSVQRIGRDRPPR
jgi:polyisoprenyl-phosphate glycosyltransferase